MEKFIAGFTEEFLQSGEGDIIARDIAGLGRGDLLQALNVLSQTPVNFLKLHINQSSINRPDQSAKDIARALVLAKRDGLIGWGRFTQDKLKMNGFLYEVKAFTDSEIQRVLREARGSMSGAMATINEERFGTISIGIDPENVVFGLIDSEKGSHRRVKVPMKSI